MMVYDSYALGVSKAGIYVGVSEVGSHHISFSWHPPIDSESTVSMFIVSLRKIHDMMSRDVIDEDVIHKRTTKLAMTVNGLTPSTLYEIKVSINSNNLKQLLMLVHYVKYCYYKSRNPFMNCGK